jgi:hypothetical protein
MRSGVLIAVLCLLCNPAEGARAGTPEAAVQAFESAYLRGDADAAVAAWDFEKSAHLYVETMFPPFMWPQFEPYTVQRLQRELREAIQKKDVARFGVSACTITGKQRVTKTLVRLIETCRWADGFESSQALLVFHGSAGWRLVQYPSTRVFQPVCLSDDPLGIRVCSERDGSQVTAVQNGREMWRKDVHTDWKVGPRMTLYPVIWSMKTVPVGYRQAYERLISEHAIFIDFDSLQFGVVDEETGTFTMLGQN